MNFDHCLLTIGGDLIVFNSCTDMISTGSMQFTGIHHQVLLHVEIFTLERTILMLKIHIPSTNVRIGLVEITYLQYSIMPRSTM